MTLNGFLDAAMRAPKPTSSMACRPRIGASGPEMQPTHAGKGKKAVERAGALPPAVVDMGAEGEAESDDGDDA
jgi:hypothetical protein